MKGSECGDSNSALSNVGFRMSEAIPHLLHTSPYNDAQLHVSTCKLTKNSIGIKIKIDLNNIYAFLAYIICS